MTRTACLMIAALLVLGCRADAKSTTTFRRNSSWRAPDVSGRARDRGAHERRKATVKAMFKRAGVAFPPAEMMLRVFKREARLAHVARDDLRDLLAGQRSRAQAARG